MPRARRIDEQEQAEAVTLVPAGADDAPEGADASEQWEEFEQLRDQGEGGTAGMHVWVYRIPTDVAGNPISNVDSALLFTAPIDVYTLPQIYDRVKREYMARGIGRALIRIQVRREKARGVLWQKMVPIEKGIRDDEAAPAAAASSSDPAIGALAQAMSQQNALLARLFEQRQSAPQVDPFAGAKSMVEMVAALAGILVNKTNAPAGPAANSMGDMISAIREIRKLSLEMAPEGGGDDGDGNSIAGILTAGKPYAELLGALLSRAPAQPQPGMRRLPPAQFRSPTPAPGPAPGTVPAREPPPQPTAPPAAQGNDPMLALLSKHVSDICDLIEQGKAEPQGIAGLILDAVPEQFDEKFYAIVSDENWLTKLAAVEPRVRNHADFFTQVRGFVLQEFADDTAGDAAAS